jgi:hypothetical protein
VSVLPFSGEGLAVTPIGKCDPKASSSPGAPTALVAPVGAYATRLLAQALRDYRTRARPKLVVPTIFLGLVLFGGAPFWARVNPRWIAVLLIILVPVTMFLDPKAGTFQESIGPALWGFAVAAYGFCAFRRAPTTTTTTTSSS